MCAEGKGSLAQKDSVLCKWIFVFLSCQQLYLVVARQRAAPKSLFALLAPATRNPFSLKQKRSLIILYLQLHTPVRLQILLGLALQILNRGLDLLLNLLQCPLCTLL